MTVPEFFAEQLAGDVTLQHRIKEPYSMWKKMQRQGGGVDGVFDAVALRVIMKARRNPGETDEDYNERSRQLCYHVSVPRSADFPLRYFDGLHRLGCNASLGGIKGLEVIVMSPYPLVTNIYALP